MAKQILKYLVVISVGIILIRLIEIYSVELVQTLQTFNYDQAYSAQMKLSVCGIMFGVLIEWNKIISLVRSKPRINLLIIPALILLIINFIPLMTLLSITTHFGFMGLSDQVLLITNIVTGILLVRSFTKE